jgi:hypothetical protein
MNAGTLFCCYAGWPVGGAVCTDAGEELGWSLGVEDGLGPLID